MDGGNTLRLDAGVYQRVRYNAMEVAQSSIVKYGFVDEFLVLGAGEGAFEKLLDIYRKDTPSIRENPKFTDAVEEIGSGVAMMFADIPFLLSIISDLDAVTRERFAIFQSIFARLNLLETEPFFRASVQFNPDIPEGNEIGLFLKKGAALKTPNALSAQHDLFAAIAPNILEGVWKLVRIQMERDETGEADAGITFLEGLLNLNLEEDVMTGLTGELALSVPDFTQFNPDSVSNINLELLTTFELDASAVDTEGTLIFSPSNHAKWNQIGNSLSNLQNASISQIDHNGTIVSGFDSSIYYSTLNDLFLIGFAEEQVCTLLDEIKKNEKPSHLKQMPKTPVAFAQLNLARMLETTGRGPAPADRVIVSAKEMEPFLVWTSVEDNELSLEILLSLEDTPLEVLAKLAPFYVWAMEN